MRRRLRPFELTAIRISGNASGGIHVPGWRALRTTERRAISQTCVANRLMSSSEPSSVWPVLARKTSSSDGWWRLISAARRFSWSSARITSASAPCPSSCTALAPGRAAVSTPKRPRIDASRRPSSPSSGTTSTVGLPISALSAAGRALGDDPAVVDDPDPVGEHVGLLEVLRRQEDRHALVARQPPDLVPERCAALRVEARSSARRGRGSTASGSGRAPGRAGASSRRSRCGSCGRLPTSARRGPAGGRSAPAAARRGSRAASLQPQVLAPGQERVERGLLEGGADRRRAPSGPPGRCRSRRPWPGRPWAAGGWSACAPWSTCPAPFGPRKP